MAKVELLNNVAHKDLRVRAGHSAAFGDNVNIAAVFPTEFADVQREYPILFRKDANGAYQSVALTGLEKGENLFLEETGWRARYVPAMHQRGPFMIGFQQKQVEGQVVREPMVHVDLEHPRVSFTEGEPVFLPQGGNAPFLERTTRFLQILFHGVEHAQPMFAAFEQAGLIQSMDIEIKLDDRTTYALPGFYSISQERLGKLGGAELERLNALGYLHLAMLVVTSLGNVSWLIELKNKRRAVG